MSNILREFKDFISRGNVVDLAVGIIIGTSFTAIVNSLVNDVVMPPIGQLLGNVNFSNFFINLSPTHYDTLAAAKAAGAATINYGVFFNNVLTLRSVGAVTFKLVNQVNRFRRAQDAAPPPPPRSETLLEEIRDILKNK